ncbi:uncharacterized protein DDB_G0274171-like [Dreissena polymorpha]|uniref:Uncharacterized protein n=1 Tax=Dreissena polymorpha TaxID=45954 RepID=A0A9D4LBA3_DREPO|nr:uncharacterized protein DDB_G0274171-like [Dreissena polymorpha]KAH3854890.1 hypothetical protein DPMN_097449 [Dreissena polymorpha]
MTTIFVTVVLMLLTGWLSDVNGIQKRSPYDNCMNIQCGWPKCPDGATPVTRPGACCPDCPEPCDGIQCGWPRCPYGATPVTRPGDCCPSCP